MGMVQPPVQPVGVARDRATESARAAIATVEASAAQPLDSLARRREEARTRAMEDDVRHRRLYAIWLLVGMGVQLVIVDGIFLGFAIANHWVINEGTMSAWIGATFVQVVAVVLVVAHYLFPRGGSSTGTEA
jgi:hypothetical protein